MVVDIAGMITILRTVEILAGMAMLVTLPSLPTIPIYPYLPQREHGNVASFGAHCLIHSTRVANLTDESVERNRLYASKTR